MRVPQQIGLLLLLLCTTATSSSAAPPGPLQRPSPRSFKRTAAAVPAGVCPGVVHSPRCSAVCRRAICTALDDFYDATYNPSYANWARRQGWEGSIADCMQDPSSSSSSNGNNSNGGQHHHHDSMHLPRYCDRFGIDCCEPEEHQRGQCPVVGGITDIVLEVNYLNGSVSDPDLLSALRVLHDCGLTQLVLQGNDLSGTLSEDWGSFTRLTHLNLANNWISGTLPPSLRQLKRLKHLALGANFLHGTLPSWFGELSRLRELRLGANLGSNPATGTRGFEGPLHESLGKLTSLQVLDLQANSLTGELPRSLCNSSRHLEMLQVRNNRLGGSLEPLAACTMLTQLDVSGNAFNGTLPRGRNWSRLVVLDASHNTLSGSIPSGLYHLPVLAYLSLSHNRLSGSVSRDIALLTYLTQLKLSHNYFSGVLEDGIWTLPQLQHADFSNNYFYGTLSRMTGLTISLLQLSLDNNSFVGPLPPDLGLLRNLNRISLRKTNISCRPLPAAKYPAYYSNSSSNSTNSSSSVNSTTAFNSSNTTTNATYPGGIAAMYGGSSGTPDDDNNSNPGAFSSLYDSQSTYQCSDAELLPCFLTFSEHAVPRTDRTNMACPAIVRLPHDEAVVACSGSAPYQLGVLAPGVAVTQTGEQSWELDPSYYQYRKCVCLKGYAPSWSQNNTLLTCLPKSYSNTLSPTVITAITASAAGVLLLAAVGLLVWLRLAVQLRPRWQREKELAAHRKMGVPCGSPATIVVTDIEHYSSMMKLNPQLTTRALGLHNAVMRRSAAAHAGHVIEQEGDSWSVAFHSAMDAVAFCLQVQQALAKTNWPGDIGSGSSRRAAAHQHPHSRTLNGSDTAPHSGGEQQHTDSSGSTTPRFAAHNNKVKPNGSWSSCSSGSGGGSSSLAEQQQHAAAHSDMQQGTDSVPSSPFSTEGSAQQHDSSTNSSSPDAQGGTLARWLKRGGRTSTQDSKGGEGTRCFSSADQDQKPQHHHHHHHHHAAAAAAATVPADIDHSPFCTAEDFADDEVFDGIIPALRSVASRHSQHGPARGSSVGAAGGGSRGGSGLLGHQSSRFWSLIGFDRAGGHGGSSSIMRGSTSINGNNTAGAHLVAGGGGGHNSNHSGGVPEVLRGLKVRMGVASGFAPADTHICRCALMQLAKAVSDMANGGQVLLDGPSFEGIRDRLTELGTVDHRGYNDKLWRAAAKAAMRQHTTGLMGFINGLTRCCSGSSLQAAVLDTDALALAMGVYYQHHLARLLPHAVHPAPSSSSSASSAADAVGLSATATAAVGDAAVAAAALTLASGSSSNSSGSSTGSGCSSSCSGSAATAELSLYSVCPRSLQGRVKVWGSQLSFKEGTQQVGRGYFQAPGAMRAELGTPACADLSADVSAPLPRMTMVFAEVEGGRTLVRRRPEVARLVHTTLTRLLQVLLSALPEVDGPQGDGYLCREQEGDMKYMVAFREPCRALEWCLLVQEVLLYVPWPQEVLEELSQINSSSCNNSNSNNTNNTSALDAITAVGASLSAAAAAGGAAAGKGGGSASSSSACTGPCMRMGLAEGQPQTIMPDHLGHADYHGFHINLAARLMGAAAAPGQVVTSIETAEHIFSTWRYEAEGGAGPQHLQGGAPHQKQHQDDTAVADKFLPSSKQQQAVEQPHQQQQAAPPQRHPLQQFPTRPDISTLLGKITQLSPAPSYSPRRVCVGAHHLGSYAFKGCGTVEVVTFLTDTIPVLDWPKADSKGAKGTLVSAASGPVVGLQDCPVTLPAVLPVLRNAWRVAEELVAAAAGAAASAATCEPAGDTLQTKKASSAAPAVSVAAAVAAAAARSDAHLTQEEEA